MAHIETDVLIVGSGPAGGAMGLFLATYGVDAIIITRFHRLIRTPRAHLTNQRTLEILRDIGVEDQVRQQATPQHLISENVFCASLAGEEIGRIHAWGNHPSLQAEHKLSSPCEYVDLPQNLMEPILIHNASLRGTKVCYNNEYVSHEQDKDSVTATIKDRLTGETYTVRCKYLYGADGGNSPVAEHAGLPFDGEMGLDGSMNIVFDADLSKYVAHRPGVLYWLIQSGSNVGGIGMGVLRMVQPWRRWLMVWGYDISRGAPELTEAMARELLHNAIGDRSIDVQVDSTSLWTINNQYAAKMHDRRVFIGGDAAHRHPPTNGLGSNVSMQDSYNLAWKLAMVIKGQANPSLLESYSQERVPIAKQTVERANKSITNFYPIFGALHLRSTENQEEVTQNLAALQANTPQGREQREQLRQAIKGTDYVYNAHGVEMNQRYGGSAAVVSDESPEPTYERDAELHYAMTTWPGARLPHAWLRRGKHGSEVLSTLDLVGKGRFTVLTGIGGDRWIEAAEKASRELGLEFAVVSIGLGQDVQDIYGDWAERREIEEDGMLLVRPDGYVGWRHNTLSDNAEELLIGAVKQILGRD